MALNYNQNINSNWRRSAFGATASAAPRNANHMRPQGSFNNNLVNNINKLNVAEGSRANSSQLAGNNKMDLPAGFNLKPPGRGLSPASLSTGQKDNANGGLKPPASMAYNNLLSNRSQGANSEREGMAQFNRSVNRAAARDQGSGASGPGGVRQSSQPQGGKQRYYEQLAEQAAARHGVDPNLVKAVITAESGYNPQVVSKAGAMGLMQLMPGTARDMQVRNPFDAKQNIEGGTKYLAWLTKQFDGDESKILAAYNWGPGNVQRGGNLPSETRNYLVKVSQYKQEYQQVARRESQSRQAKLENKADV